MTQQIAQMRQTLKQHYNGVYRGVHVDDMSDAQVFIIHNNLCFREKKRREQESVQEEIRKEMIAQQSKPKIIFINGDMYMLKDSGIYELIEDDYNN